MAGVVVLLYTVIPGCALPGAPADAGYTPDGAESWRTVEPAGAGWNENKLNNLLAYAERQNSSALLILLHGRILAESYWHVPAEGEFARFVRGRTEKGPIEDVASIQKSVVGLLAGMAHRRGRFRPDTPVSDLMGSGWSDAPPGKEKDITVRHLLSMASGLDRTLRFSGPPVSEWEYNTRGFMVARKALVRAVNMPIRKMTRRWLRDPLGMNHSGWFERPGDGKNPLGFRATARDLGRLGLMVMRGGRWGQRRVMKRDALQQVIKPSQQVNPAFGWFWWINGADPERRWEDFRSRTHRGKIFEAAPGDMVMAYGRFGRYLCVAPERGLVVVRLGYEPTDGFEFGGNMWKLLISAAPDRASVGGLD